MSALKLSLIHQNFRITWIQSFEGFLYASEGCRLWYVGIAIGTNFSIYTSAHTGIVTVFPNNIQISYFKFQRIRKDYALLFVGSRLGGNIYRVTSSNLDNLRCDSCHDENSHPLQYSPLHYFKDDHMMVDGWNIAVQFIFSNNDEVPFMVAITNQNEAVIWELQTMSLVKARVLCLNQVSIVTADIVGNTLEELLIVTGTSSSEVCMWTINSDEATNLYSFREHQGEITSVHFYPNEGVLLSTSDDRTAVALQFKSSEPDISPLEGLLHKKDLPQETLIRKHTPTSKLQNALLSAGMLLTFGKNGVVKMWNTSGEYLSQWDVHAGSPIWVYSLHEESKVVFTGSENGTVAALNLDPLPLGISKASTHVEITDGPNRGRVGPDYPVAVSGYDDNRFFVISNKGFLISLTLVPFRGLEIFSAGSSKVTMCLSKDQHVLAYAYGNTIVLFDISEDDSPHLRVQEVARYSLDFTELPFCPVDRILQLGHTGFLVVTRNSIGRLRWSPQATSFELLKGNIHFTKFIWPSKFGDCFVTAAEQIYEETDFETEICCVLGDKNGYLYDVEFGSRDKVIIKRMDRIGGRQAVTYIKYSGHYEIASLSRDGFLTQIRCAMLGPPPGSNHHVLINLRRERLPFDFPSLVSNYNGLDIVVGFRSKNVVFYSLETSSIILELECGGVHRAWDLVNTSTRLTFAYTQDQKLNSYSMNHLGRDFYIVKAGTHVGTINCGTVTITGADCFQKLGTTLLATGGESNSIILTELVKDQEESPYRVIKLAEFGHMRGSVRCLFYIGDTTRSGYLISGGGSSELMVFKIMKLKSGTQVNVQAYSCTNVAQPRRFKGTGDKSKTDETKDDIVGDVRVLDVCGYSTLNYKDSDDDTPTEEKTEEYYATIRHPQHILTIFAACSDGKIRIFSTNTKNKHYLWFYGILKYEDTEGSAVTRLFHEKMRDVGHSIKESHIVLGISSNGYLLVWKLEFDPRKDEPKNYELMPIVKVRVFDCAITALEVASPLKAKSSTNTSTFIVATGGDSGCLKVHRVLISLNEKVEVSLIWSDDNTHRGTIMSIKKDIFNPSLFYAASTDGILTAWNFSGGLLLCSTTTITDCQCLISADKGHLLICCGNGISALKVVPTGK